MKTDDDARYNTAATGSTPGEAKHAEFRPYHSQGDLGTYRRNLPHWQQKGATYFVTFRQADSIPKAVLAQWQDTKERWFSANGIPLAWERSAPDQFTEACRALPYEQRREFERRQARMLHDELDRCRGSCLLRQSGLREIVANSLHYFDSTRLWLGDFVIMPNHAHALLQPFRGWKLEKLLGSIKQRSSRRIREILRERDDNDARIAALLQLDRFWQPESFDRIVRDGNELNACRRYIALNPRKAHLSDKEFTYYKAQWLGPFNLEI